MSRQHRKLIKSLIVNDKKIDNEEAVLKEIVTYYETLYSQSSDNLDYDSYLDQVNLPHILTDNEANKCECLITTA